MKGRKGWAACVGLPLKPSAAPSLAPQDPPRPGLMGLASARWWTPLQLLPPEPLPGGPRPWVWRSTPSLSIDSSRVPLVWGPTQVARYRRLLSSIRGSCNRVPQPGQLKEEGFTVSGSWRLQAHDSGLPRAETGRASLCPPSRRLRLVCQRSLQFSAACEAIALSPLPSSRCDAPCSSLSPNFSISQGHSPIGSGVTLPQWDLFST